MWVYHLAKLDSLSLVGDSPKSIEALHGVENLELALKSVIMSCPFDP